LLVDSAVTKKQYWPFSTVTPSQFEELGVVDKAAIDGYIDARIALPRDKPNKDKAA